MTTLHATPYNIDATGFYFTDINEYETKAKSLVDRYGNLVEEFEIQFIDGNDFELFEACGINQANLNQWYDDIEFLQDDEKVSLYYLVGVAGYSLDQALLKKMSQVYTKVIYSMQLPSYSMNAGCIVFLAAFAFISIMINLRVIASMLGISPSLTMQVQHTHAQTLTVSN